MIRIEGLTKSYGRTVAIQDLSFEVKEGEIFGFVGPNGAGKTTTLRILATLLDPDRGNAWIDRLPVRENVRQVRKLVGFMPDEYGLYEDTTVEEYLVFFAEAYLIPQNRIPPLVDDILNLIDLNGKRDAELTALSRGMRQRLLLGKTLLHDPKVLLLDEPASGLDPRGRIEIRELLRELGKMGKTIIVSSHILSEIGELCTTVGIIEAGHMVTVGSLRDILAASRSICLLRVRIRGDIDRAKDILLEHPLLSEVSVDGDTFTAIYRGDEELVGQINTSLVQAGIEVRSFSLAEGTLEEAFLRATEGKVT
jgi:ABC-2 type transport system ATP-binding protein